MQDLFKQLDILKQDIEQAIIALDVPALEISRDELEQTVQKQDFWDNPVHAQKTMKHLSSIKARIDTWRELEQSTKELLELTGLNDPKLETDLRTQYEILLKKYEVHKVELQFSGAYDTNNAILEIHAGAGGTDAQDWAEMLLRMYLRWAESNDYDAEVIAKSTGEEAGIKSATLEINGSFAYGKLQGEHGVHRLVRLSPFNADSLRQTSFAKVAVMPKIDEPEAVAIDEKDLKIDVFRAGGHGGQSVNTTDSAVRITHLPTGITVSIQNERSQLQNKETAMTIVRSRLVQMTLEQHKEKIDELKGPNQSAEWGSQIRSYVLHPYKQVKDLRSKYETSDVQGVLDGDLNELIQAYLDYSLGS